jgi:hypothetical protein
MTFGIFRIHSSQEKRLAKKLMLEMTPTNATNYG